MAMNLIGEIAQYAIETDQVIRQLAKERDDLRRVADAQQEEIESLRRRITDGKIENERQRDRITELSTELHDLHAVRKTDNGAVKGATDNG